MRKIKLIICLLITLSILIVINFACADKQDTDLSVIPTSSPIIKQSNQIHNIEEWDLVKDQYYTLTGNFTDDLLTVARSQLGYVADESRYDIVDGEIKHWSLYGNFATKQLNNRSWNCCHWCDAFASFCIYYAGLTDYPFEVSTQRHQKLLKDTGYWREWSQYIPKPGDLVFFDLKNKHSVNHVGIIEEVIYSNPIKIITIEGNVNNGNKPSCVKRFTRTLDNVIGYGTFSVQEQNENTLNKLTWRDDNSTELINNNTYYTPTPNRDILIQIGANHSIFANYLFPGIDKEYLSYKLNETIDSIHSNVE